MAEDHYRTLNVTPNATIDEIQRAYRALARRFHPDRNRLPHASTVMAGINEAYDVLGEPSKRAAYDRGHGKHDNRIDEAIMQGASDTPLRQGWTVCGNSERDFILKKESRQVYVTVVSVLNASTLPQSIKHADGFRVVLAVHIDASLAIGTKSVALIDIMHSRLHYGGFPDSTYRDLFKTFLGS